MLPSNLRLRNNQLERIAAIGLLNGMLQDADRFKEVAGHPDLAREVRRVGDDLLSLCLELHRLVVVVVAVLHSCLNPRNLAAIVMEHLVDAGVEHVCTAVDCGEARKALRKLTKAVKRVDVRRLPVPGHGVHIQANAVDGFGGHAGFCDVEIGLEQSHRVADEVTGVILEAKLVVYILHRALGNVQTWVISAIVAVANSANNTNPGESPGRPP